MFSADRTFKSHLRVSSCLPEPLGQIEGLTDYALCIVLHHGGRPNCGEKQDLLATKGFIFLLGAEKLLPRA